MAEAAEERPLSAERSRAVWCGMDHSLEIWGLSVPTHGFTGGNIMRRRVFPECVAKGSRLTQGVWG